MTGAAALWWFVVVAGCGADPGGQAPQSPPERILGQARPALRPGAPGGAEHASDKAKQGTGGPRKVVVRPDPVAPASYPPVSREELRRLLRRSWHAAMAGEILLHLEPGHYIVEPRGSSDLWKVAHHRSVYERESRVPLLLHSPTDPRRRVHPERVELASIGATLFDLLDVERPEWVKAPALDIEAPLPLRAIVVLIFDALPAQILDEELPRLPAFRALRERSTVYEQAWLGHVTSATTVSHAVIGTGATPSVHGVAVNHKPIAPGQRVEVFRDGDITPLLVPTLADLYDRACGNRPQIISFCSQSRAAVGMAGHGTAWPGGDRDLVVFQRDHVGAPTTWGAVYGVPRDLQAFTPERFLRGRGSPLADSTDFERRLFYSPLTVEYCEEVVNRLVDGSEFGTDAITDLLFFNQKVMDNLGHCVGPSHPLYRTGLEAADRFLGRFVASLERRFGGAFLLIVTADHGIGPTRRPTDPSMHSRPDLMKEINQAFRSPLGPVVTNVHDLYLYLWDEALRAGGYRASDLSRWIEERYDWVVHAMPVEEVLPEHRNESER